MLKITTVSQMRELDKGAVERYGIPEAILMENAGNSVYFLISAVSGVKGKKFVVFCGSGNNGGDGFVVARKLHSSGAIVKVYLIGSARKMKEVTLRNYEALKKAGVHVSDFKSSEEVLGDVENADAVVDAILGTGISREVAGLYKDAIEVINGHARLVYSVDIPSGVNGDTGEVMGVAVKSDYTVTFGLPKVGNLLYPGYMYCGRLYVSHISFPPQHYNRDDILLELNSPIMLPERLPYGYKGTFGDVFFVAGARGYYGAPYFSAYSFMKAGGGYARLSTPLSCAPFVGNRGSEIVIVPMDETEDGSLAKSSFSRLMEIADRVDMVVVGPGVSLNQETKELIREIVRAVDKPVVIDGDGLTAVSEDLNVLKERTSPTVLTPHAGEMSRLSGMTIKDVLGDRLGVLRRMTEELGAVIVLKGAHTLIGYPGGKVLLNMTGNSGMATAGSGDVLTGAIAAMFGLGMSLEDAVRMGVFIHGLSGDLAAKDRGVDGITAQDILDYLPVAVNMLRKEFKTLFSEYSIPVI